MKPAPVLSPTVTLTLRRDDAVEAAEALQDLIDLIEIGRLASISLTEELVPDGDHRSASEKSFQRYFEIMRRFYWDRDVPEVLVALSEATEDGAA